MTSRAWGNNQNRPMFLHSSGTRLLKDSDVAVVSRLTRRDEGQADPFGGPVGDRIGGQLRPLSRRRTSGLPADASEAVHSSMSASPVVDRALEPAEAFSGCARR
jgi:hypothetical protein